ncbi:hypothetical protein PIROE2DRAFT_2230 [Piromyces sp. E2]|nr:hypothetical protein PIROE2DRAFT_2230 [Piromyces sp. E2]|eukprot:OUM69803.1 hypothetical protein PIROE2DRAFT_2230 [Piromyces sp. E2]
MVRISIRNVRMVITPSFFNACKNGNETLLRYLVERGADIHKENKKGKTPLLTAYKYGKMMIIRYLIEHGADITKVDSEGKPPLFEASSHLFHRGNANTFLGEMKNENEK